MRFAAALITGLWTAVVTGHAMADTTAPDAAPFTASFNSLPVQEGRELSRAFPHGHPLHVCGPEDDTHPWLQSRRQENPWSFMRGEAERESDALH